MGFLLSVMSDIYKNNPAPVDNTLSPQERMHSGILTFSKNERLHNSLADSILNKKP